MKFISDQRELEASMAKLAVLEAELCRVDETEANPAVRHTTRISLSRLINRFKEEISRYHAGVRSDPFAHRALRTPQEAENTRRKLEELESLLEAKSHQPEGPATRLSTGSLRRMRNKLKEELLTYGARSRQTSQVVTR